MVRHLAITAFLPQSLLTLPSTPRASAPKCPTSKQHAPPITQPRTAQLLTRQREQVHRVDDDLPTDGYNYDYDYDYEEYVGLECQLAPTSHESIARVMAERRRQMVLQSILALVFYTGRVNGIAFTNSRAALLCVLCDLGEANFDGLPVGSYLWLLNVLCHLILTVLTASPS